MGIFKINRGKFLSIITAVILLLSLAAVMPVSKVSSLSEIVGSTATGADFKYGQTVTEINVETMFGADKMGNEYSQSQIQAALDYAGDNAADDNMVKVYIPAGTYLLRTRLTVYSNTWIYCEEGTVFKRCTPNGPLLCSASAQVGGYDDTRNIIIEGGTWDGNTDEYRNLVGFSNIRFAHCNNILFKNMNIINNQGGHHLEIGGAKDITIEGCSFSGYFDYFGNNKEAIQLDTMNSESIFVGYAPYDDTSCENVIIRNNSFSDIPRGLGSHSATVGVYYRNITIENNTFTNMSHITMIMYNYKNCTIRNNVINGCVSGIELKNMSGHPDNNFHAPAVSDKMDMLQYISPFSDAIIENNQITTDYHGEEGYATGIIISGQTVQNANNVPDGEYSISGVIISNNEINTVGAGITLNLAKDTIVNGNDIYFNNGKQHFSDKNDINMGDCTNVTVSDNFLSSSSKYGITINSGSENTILGNTIQNTASIAINMANSSLSNIISGNNIYNSGHHGIYITSGASADINTNFIDNAGKNGIVCYSNTKCTVQNNTVNYSGYHGISMEKVQSGTISSNIVENSAKDGVLVYNSSANVTVSDNKIINNGKNGITVCKNVTSGIKLLNNTIKNASQFGISVNTNAKAYISGNIIQNTKSHNIAVSNDSSVTVPTVANVKALQITPSSVKISYNKVSPTAVYEIYRKTSSGSYQLIKTTTALSCTDSGLASGTYNYKVRAYETTSGKKTYGNYSTGITFKAGSKTSIQGAAVTTAGSVSYTGNPVTPSFTVKKDGKTLTKGTDYTISYSNNIKVGTAKAVITGKGNYKDSVTVNFNIVPKKQSVTSVTATSNKISFSWKKSSCADGYEYQVAASQDFNKTSVLSINKNTTTSKSISATQGKTYYVRVRDFKIVSGKKIVGEWSNSKKITCQ